MSIVAKLLYGLQVMIIGLLVVFIMLALLIGFLKIMAKIFEVIDAKKKAAQPAAPAPAPAPVEPEPEYEEVTDDNELIAVIAAAIAAYGAKDSDKPLVVRKVRRVAGWKNATRAEQVSRF